MTDEKDPHTVVMWLDSDGDYVAGYVELNGCMAHGATQEEALRTLRDVKRDWIAMRTSMGFEVPAPLGEDEAYKVLR